MVAATHNHTWLNLLLLRAPYLERHHYELRHVAKVCQKGCRKPAFAINDGNGKVTLQGIQTD